MSSEISKKAEFVTQFVPFSVNKKELLTKIYTHFKQEAFNDGNYEKTVKLMSDIENYLYALTEPYSDFVFSVPDNISALLKMCDLRFEETADSLTEKVLGYLCAVNEYMGKAVVITVNLRSYISDKDAENLFNELAMKKINLICIENKEYKCLPGEHRVIIDKDMCVI